MSTPLDAAGAGIKSGLKDVQAKLAKVLRETDIEHEAIIPLANAVLDVGFTAVKLAIEAAVPPFLRAPVDGFLSMGARAAEGAIIGALERAMKDIENSVPAEERAAGMSGNTLPSGQPLPPQ